MLTKRAQILFDVELWNKLVKLAESRKISVAEYVREITKKDLAETKILEQRRKAFESILKHRPKPFKGKIDYKALINYGRKY
ncbi:MAG: hypothetical protein Q7R43_00415 [Candidatus Daviesbacteria bacterium]|nr:hypothetical protein [Candidatus Daviesbacteria bacterium]